jgi:hypothetical protein
MRSPMIETLEDRMLFSAAPAVQVAALEVPTVDVPTVDVPMPRSLTPAVTTSIPVPEGRYKGSSVSSKGFTTRLTVTLGKEHPGGTIIGTFDYLDGFQFVMHLRLGADNTFHATLAIGNVTGTLLDGRITTADDDTVIDLSGPYTFSNGSTVSDMGTFLVRN